MYSFTRKDTEFRSLVYTRYVPRRCEIPLPVCGLHGDFFTEAPHTSHVQQQNLYVLLLLYDNNSIVYIALFRLRVLVLARIHTHSRPRVLRVFIYSRRESVGGFNCAPIMLLVSAHACIKTWYTNGFYDSAVRQ